LRIAYLPLFSKRHQTNPLAEDELRTRAERHLAYGLKYLEGANPEHAIVELSLAEPAFGDDASLYEKLGDACSLASGRDLGRDLLEKAAEDIQSFTSDYPSSFQHEMAGRGNLTALFRDRARSAYARARELGGDSALLRRKQIALESDPERTAELYAEALAAFPRDFSLRLDHIAFEQGRFEVKTTQDRDRKAEQHLNALRRLAQDFPKSARAQYELLIHTPWSTETCPRAVERGLAAARLSGMPEYTDILPDRSQEVVDSPRRCLEFALGQMNWLSAQFERDKDYTQAMQWRERHFETKLDWGIAPDTEWERRQAIGSLRRLYEALEIEDQLIPYLERAVADLMPDAERHGWQREIRRLRREASYITTWDTFPVGNQTTTPGRISGRLFDRYVNLRTALDPGDGQTVGCQTTLVSPQDQDVVLHLGFDETVRVELNGTEVFRGQRRIAVADEYRVPVRLKEGKNTLSLTVGNRRLAHGFFLRVADSEGNPIEDLVTKPSM
jgi:hypothetical protein